MPDRKPRRMVGVPRPPRMSKPAWQWGIAGGLLWLVLVAIETVAFLALLYLLVEFALPVAVDAVMDAVEQRE